MMGFELKILGKSQFQVATSTGSYLEDGEIKGYLNPKISSPSHFIFSSTLYINVSPFLIALDAKLGIY